MHEKNIFGPKSKYWLEDSSNWFEKNISAPNSVVLFVDALEWKNGVQKSLSLSHRLARFCALQKF